jgi:hypothetical protein
MNLASVISDEVVPLESFDSLKCNSSDSDSDYASEKNEVNEQVTLGKSPVEVSGNQCKNLRWSDICSYFPTPTISLAAAFWTR